MVEYENYLLFNQYLPILDFPPIMVYVFAAYILYLHILFRLHFCI